MQKFNFWGVLLHLTAKFHIQTSSVMHTNEGFPLFLKLKTPNKMKILKEEKNMTANIFLLVGVFVVFFTKA